MKTPQTSAGPGTISEQGMDTLLPEPGQEPFSKDLRRDTDSYFSSCPGLVLVAKQERRLVVR